MTATNPYTSKVTSLEQYRTMISMKSHELSQLIGTLSRVDSSTLNGNNFPGNYYKGFKTEAEYAIEAAEIFRDYIDKNILPSVEERLRALRSIRDAWKPQPIE